MKVELKSPMSTDQKKHALEFIKSSCFSARDLSPIWADEAAEEWHFAHRLGMLKGPQEVEFEQDLWGHSRSVSGFTAHSGGTIVSWSAWSEE